MLISCQKKDVNLTLGLFDDFEEGISGIDVHLICITDDKDLFIALHTALGEISH